MHHSVLLKEAIDSLDLKQGEIVLDATLGGGGHASKILEKILPGGRLIGIDADNEALERSKEALKDFKDSITFIHGNFRDLDTLLPKANVKKLDGALFDLGVSSYQLDDGSRGFSIRHNARLDMRMNKDTKRTAYDVINYFKERDLSDIIKAYGEERFHNRVARFIVEERSRKPIETTHELASVVRRAVGFRYRKSRIDPATRTFQAIRIVVNDELGALEDGLKKAVSWLGPEARISAISFHSLEDRIVKNLFKSYAELGVLKIITKKPLTVSHEETKSNPRSRSAKLRTAERI